MKKLLSIGIASLFAYSSQGQEYKNFEDLNKFNAKNKNIDTVAWVYAGNLNIGLNQGILHNWPAGGEIASLTVNGLFNGTLTRYNNRSVWTNNLDLAYGLLYTYSNQFIPRKTDDRIDLTSKYGYRIAKEGNLYYTALFNAKTQFTKAFDYDTPNWDTFSTSKFLSPLYFTLAPGLEYRKGSNVSIFFSPLASRATLVDQYYTNKSPEGAFGVQHGKTFRFELGAYLTSRYEVAISKNVTYIGRLDLYSNYLAKDTYNENNILVKEDNPGNIDIMIDNILNIKVTKYIGLNLGINALYDNDIPFDKYFINEFNEKELKKEPFKGLGWWQIKQVMTIGFNYKF